MMRKLSVVLGASVILVGALSAAFGQQVTVSQFLNIIIAAGKQITFSNTLTFAGTDGTTMTFPSSSDTVVTLGATQTLANKTLTAPNIGVATATTINGATYDNNAWTSYTPTVTAGSGTFTSAGASGRYQFRGKTLSLQVTVTIATVGSAGNSVIVTLPLSATVPAASTMTGFDGGTNKSLAVFINGSSNTAVITSYDGTSVIGPSKQLFISGVVEVN